MKKAVVLFGEVMMRLNTEGFLRFVQADKFDVYYTGAEANAGAELAAWGIPARVVSKVPAHEIGQACVNYLRRFGLDTAFIQRGGDRLGILYVENGSSQRQSKVVYDRSGSSFTTFDDKDVDWRAVFKDAQWLHFSGTAPALSKRLVPVLKRACAAAKQCGVTISCDLNFRKKLWSAKTARKVMTELAEFIDVLICNEEDADVVYGIKARDTDITGGKLSREGYEDVARRLQERFRFSHVAITLRESVSATVNNWSALLYTKGKCHFSKRYNIHHIVDRVGGGDAFAGGLIYGLCERMAPQDTVEFAVAASCLKHAVTGDFNLVSLAEVEALASGDGSGRIQR